MAAAKLAVTEGPLAGRDIEVDRELVVGRVDADVTIVDPELSRRHALLRAREGALEIQDLGSLNGTWVNGRRLEAKTVTRLARGDLVKIGESVLEVEDAPTRDAQETRLAPAEPLPGRSAPTAAPPPALAASPPPRGAAARVEAPAAAFAPPSGRPRRRVATRLAAPAVLSFAAVVATAIALVVYFAWR